jgi:hypothetical protein
MRCRRTFAYAALLAVASFCFAGCTVTKDDKKVTSLGVPEGSVQVDEGKGRLDYTAKRSGTVYVYDVTQDRLVYQTPVRDGDRVSIDPDANRLELNGRQDVDRNLRRDDRHRIYFYSDHQRNSAS